MPAETTALLMDICKGTLDTHFGRKLQRYSRFLILAAHMESQQSDRIGQTGLNVSRKVLNPMRGRRKITPEDFVHIFVGQSEWLIKYLEFVVHTLRTSSPLIYNTLLELYLRRDDNSNVCYYNPFILVPQLTSSIISYTAVP